MYGGCPVIFAALEFINFRGFESASLTQTFVIVVLPLGTPVAQRLANPTWFGASTPSADGSGAAANGSSPLISASTTGSATTAHSRRPLLASGRGNSAGGGAPGNGMFRGGVVTSQIAASRDRDGPHEKARFQHADVVDRELARIDQEDLESGVRVDYGIAQGEERVPLDEKNSRGS